jgi:gamma-glutamyltranspeptidase/glutathione hydrolase
MAAVLAVMLPLAACQGVAEQSSKLFYPDSGFRGGVAADEPQAALIGRAVLEAGGSAADAAAAMGFALAVTFPHAVGIGGGGQCVTYDQPKNATASYDFRIASPVAGGPVGVPGLVRGLALLQSRHGVLDFSKTVLPAENLARAGLTATRAMVAPIAASAEVVRADPELAARFGHGDGTLLAEGQALSQIELAATLGMIRSRGPGDLYQGQLAGLYVDAASRAGGHLTPEDLRAYRVAEGPGLVVDYGNHKVVLPGARTPGVEAFRGMFTAMADHAEAAAPERARLFAEASRAAYADAPNTVAGRDNGSAAIAAIDAGGSAVACTFSMGAPFGVGHLSRQLGIVLGSAAGTGGRYMVPVVVANQNSESAYWAGAAAMDDAAPVALLQTFLDSMGRKSAELQPAITAPRLIDAGGGIVYEPGTPADVADGLKATGQRSVEAGPLGRVAAVYCAQGMPGYWAACRFSADPRGAGLAGPARKIQ